MNNQPILMQGSAAKFQPSNIEVAYNRPCIKSLMNNGTKPWFQQCFSQNGRLQGPPSCLQRSLCFHKEQLINCAFLSLAKDKGLTP